MSARILLTGSSGQIGHELLCRLKERYEIFSPSHAEMDLEQPADIARCVRQFQPELIINAAAYTAVDKAESDVKKAMAVNAEAPRVLAEEADKAGAVLMHYSTDFVFDGCKGAPYSEDDKPDPLNVYGLSKLKGEEAVRGYRNHFIFRTSWIYGLRGNNFLLTIRRLMEERSSLSIVDDQIGSPTWCGSVAAATVRVIEKLDDFRVNGEAVPFGTYNMTCSGEVSWYEFARAFLPDGSELRPIPGSEYPVPAKRPSYSVLDSLKLERVIGIAMPNWRDALSECLEGEL